MSKVLAKALTAVALVGVMAVVWGYRFCGSTATTPNAYETANDERFAIPEWLATPGVDAQQVSGVVKSGGEPVAGASVFLRGPHTAADLAVASQATTDAEGRFAFGPVPVVDVWVSARGRGLGSATVVVDLTRPLARTHSRQISIELPSCDRVTAGKVTDASGAGIAAAQVRVIAGGAERQWFDAEWIGLPIDVDQTGEYQLCATAGPHTVQAGAAGYASSARTIRGEARADFSLARGGAIGGVVIADGVPAAGVAVKATPTASSEQSRAANAWTVSGDDGRFTIPRLGAGRYRLTARGLGVATVAGVDVRVDDGKSVETAVEVAPTAVITGRVTTADGAAIASVSVRAVRKSPHSWSDRAITGPDGAFGLAAVPTGNVELWVDGQPASSPTSLTVGLAEHHKVQAIATTPGAVVSGRVVKNGAAVAGAIIWVAPAGRKGRSAVARSVGGGFFEFRSSTGSFDVYADSPSHSAASPVATIEVATGRLVAKLKLDLSAAEYPVER